MKNTDIWVKLNKESALIINSNTPFFKRVWNLLTNPFYYLFTGKLRY